jgi:hypothetical protein
MGHGCMYDDDPPMGKSVDYTGSAIFCSRLI